MDTSHSAVKDTVMSLAGSFAGLMHAPAPDEVVKNTFANFAFEHYEIASYKSLLALTELAGRTNDAVALQQSLREEQAMADWIEEHIAEVIRTFASRSAVGETAGV